jgi:aminoglycoside phosphotransferase (APT) family kinase protein
MAHDLPAPAPTSLIPPAIPGEVLVAVPGCESGAPPLGVHALAGGGGHNDVRLVETRVGRFVVRRRLPPVVRAGSDAMLELECQRLAARNGLAPRVMAAAGDASWMVMEFIPGNPWVEQDLTSATGARRLGERLALVHAMPVAPTMRRMDAAQIANGQLRAINATVTSKPQRDEAAAIARHTCQLAAIIQCSDVHPCINHGDLQAANLIGNPPVLIDWEYAQIASPTYDIACLLTYYPRLKAWQSELLAASGLTRAQDLEHLALQEQLFAGLNRLWALANDMANNGVSGLGAG